MTWISIRTKSLGEDVSCSVVSDRATRLLHPWDFPGKIPGVSSRSLLKGILLSQVSNLCLLHYRRILYRLSHQEDLSE